MSDRPELDGIVTDFLVESHENLDLADQDFVELERDPTNRETLARIFRMIHTIKGSCGFLGFPRLQALAHAGESLLGRLRDGELVLDEAMTTTLLHVIDRTRATLAHIEATGAEGDEDHAALIEALEAHRRGEAPAAPARERPFDPVAAFLSGGRDVLDRMDRCLGELEQDPADRGALDALRSALAAAEEGCELVGMRRMGSVVDRAGQVIEYIREGTLPAAEDTTEMLADVGATLGEAIAETEAQGEPTDPDCGDLGRRLEAAAAAARQASAPTPQASAAPVAPTATEESLTESAFRRASITEKNIRVDVDLLDTLMNQVGELVLARNRLLRHVDAAEDEVLGSISQRLDHVTTELQGSIMMTRLQPIETVWNRLPRMVRDLGVELGKRVRLEMHGEDTELDRTLNEAIRAPMTHLVRNALDHGLETEAERIAAGKPAEGRLVLRAYHEGGQVNVEIEDDGRGIDPAAIAARAVDRGLISGERAAEMDDRGKLELIFRPGFSTAETVTNISGRGVGMDVVRSSIERINGLIDLQSAPGEGTRIRLKIPLTLAIIPALIVRCADERYAIPQVNLVAVVHLGRGEDQARIERLHHAAVYRWRGSLLPLVYLRRELGLAEPSGDARESIVVLQVEDRMFGLVVDDVTDTEEIVVKPLGRQFARIPLYAGATIMGDGRAALILDVLGLAQASTAVSEDVGSQAAEAAADPLAQRGTRRTVLMVRVGTEHAAIPVTPSVRLERFPRASIEQSGGRAIVKYRGSVLPLRTLDGAADPQALGADAEGFISVVVHGGAERNVGLVVDELLDIVEEHFTVESHVGAGAGMLGTAVVQEKIARIFDLEGVAAEEQS